MDRFIDRVYPGRSQLIRPPSAREVKATAMMGMQIETASGKLRGKHVSDDEEDYAIPAWSALYPVTQMLGVPSKCPRQPAGLTRPEEMADFELGARLDEVMAKPIAARSVSRRARQAGRAGLWSSRRCGKG